MGMALNYTAAGLTMLAAVLLIWDLSRVYIIKSLFTHQNDLIMAVYEEIKAYLESAKKSLSNVSGDILRLTEKLNNPGGLSEEQAQEVKNEFEALATNLAVLADQTPEPDPGLPE
jgi:hypothetical protein